MLAFPKRYMVEAARLVGSIPSRARMLITAALLAAVGLASFAVYWDITHAFSGGSGDWNDPYVITTCAQLQSIGTGNDDHRAAFVLGNDIDCTGVNFIPIGDTNIHSQSFDSRLPYGGRFDGAGHTISNLTAGDATAEYIGLFAELKGAYIYNLIIDNASTTGRRRVGALAGKASDSGIVGVRVINSNITLSPSGLDKLGGIVGDSDHSYFYASSVSSTTVQVPSGVGAVETGGIVGYSKESYYSNIYTTATVSVPSGNAAGVIGSIERDNLTNIYASSTVTASGAAGIIYSARFHGSGAQNTYQSRLANSYVGGRTTGSTVALGLVGTLSTHAHIDIENVFVIGPVTGAGSKAIYGGNPAERTLTNVYYDSVKTGVADCDFGWTTECIEENSAGYYTLSSNVPLSSWDFVNTWQTTATYPTLRKVPYAPTLSSTAVSTCAGLTAAIRANQDGWITLSNDIDCAGDTNLIPIGTTSDMIFSGRLDGNDHTIAGVTYDRVDSGQPNEVDFGFFKALYGTRINDTAFAGGGINSHTSLTNESNWTGGLAGSGHGVMLDGVHSTVPVEGGLGTGGLFGSSMSNLIVNSSVDADILALYTDDSGADWAGGYIGWGGFADIRDSTYEGAITSGEIIGGFIGKAVKANLNNVQATTTLTALYDYAAGGLIGYIWNYPNTSSTTITNSRSNVTFVSQDYGGFFDMGGFVGEGQYISIVNGTTTVAVENSTAPSTSNTDGIGGFIGYMDITDTTHPLTNLYGELMVTLDSTINSRNVYNIGGIIGASFGWDYGSPPITNVYASTTIILGSGSSHPNNAGYFGSVIGDIDLADMTGATGDLYVFIDGDPSVTAVRNIGGLAGEFDSGDVATSYAESILDITAYSATYVGGLLGDMHSGTVDGSGARASMDISVNAPSYIGGLIGYADTVDISESFDESDIAIASGQNGTSESVYIGGLVGMLSGGSVTDAYASTTLDIASAVAAAEGGNAIGGLVGNATNGAATSNTYASGPLTLTSSLGTATFSNVGGLIGLSNNSSNSISDGFAASVVSAASGSVHVGAFVGSTTGAETFSNIAYDATRSGLSLCTGVNGTDPIWCSIENVASADTGFFYDASNEPLVSWDFGSVWDEHSCDYPTLSIFLTLWGGSCGGGASAPSLSTAAASGIAETGATLNGSIDSEGSDTPTVRGFAYGLTAAYGATTTENGTFSTGSYSASASSLTCNTTYHFASYAMSGDGTGYGSDTTFTTSACTTGGGGGGSSHHSSSGTRDTTPPAIFNVHSAINADGSVTIDWETDEEASTQIEYGPTQCLGVQSPITDAGSDMKTKHAVTLPPSACKNSAHFSALAVDIFGNRSVSPGHSNNVLLCPASSPAPAPELLSCQLDPVAPTTPVVPAAPSEPAAPIVPAEPAGPSSPIVPIPTTDGGGGGGHHVIVNNDEPTTDDRVVPVDINPPADAVLVVISDPSDPENTVTLPATDTTITWDLCGTAPECPPGEHEVAVYFVDQDGHHSETTTSRVQLASAGFALLEDASSTPALTFDTLVPFARSLLDALATPLKSAGLAVGTFSILWAFFSTLKTFGDIPAILGRGISGMFPVGYLRRRDRPWGTVYDSRTRRPLDPAVVTLYTESGKEVKTVITDMDGRFGFLAATGRYFIKAEKGHHTFPAHEAAGVDPVFPNPYLGGPIEAGPEGVVIRDIPLDPTDFDWNEYEKYQKGLYKFFSKFDRPLAYLSLILTPLGAAVSVVVAAMSPTVFNLGFVALYVVVGVFYLGGLGPRLYGLLRNAAGEPLPFAVVRALRPGTESGVKAVADHFGRFYLLLPAGDAFDIKVEARTGENAYTPIYQRTYTGLKGHFNETIEIR